MFSTDDQNAYLERADMHEQLAAATNDIPACKMHLAMAAEYRRKARALGIGAEHASSSISDRSLKLDVAVR